MKITNFIKILDNKSVVPATWMFDVVKRNKNKKRQYLFINNYLGKHIPVRGQQVLSLFDELYDEIASNIQRNENVLIIGFAETATAIGAHIMNIASKENDFNPTYYIQTTREKINNLPFISFEEEHSHSTTQKLYLKDNIPDFDRVLFIEDEITTGKTIINFINKFEKIYPGKKYSVVSILNTQDKASTKLFQEKNIDVYYLVKAELKDTDLSYLTKYDDYEFEYIKPKEKYSYEIIDNTPRTGLDKIEFNNWLKKQIPIQDCPKGTMIIGTEENMYPAILYSARIDGFTRPTTRSPITPNKEYSIYNGFSIPSAYDSERITYIYNTDKNYEKIVLLTEQNCHPSFEQVMRELFSKHSKEPFEIFKMGLNLVNTNFKNDDVTVLLQDVGDKVPVLDNEEREKLIQSGKHYSEMIAKEETPANKYIEQYNKLSEEFSEMYYNDFRKLIDKILLKKKNPVLVSLARAGTPIGIIIKRILENDYGITVPHYTVSIIRDKGLDEKAMSVILNKHNAEDVQFVDGWIGKGTITRELRKSCQKINSLLDPELAVLTDPAYETTLCGSRTDYLVPNAIMNSHVSGGISRTISLSSMTDNDLHGTKYLTDEDYTYNFINAVSNFNTNRKGIKEIENIAKEFNISDINKIKPGIGETTRVLLRRVPDRILVSKNAEEKHIKHILDLAKDKNVPIEYYDLKNYNIVGIIKDIADL